MTIVVYRSSRTPVARPRERPDLEGPATNGRDPHEWNAPLPDRPSGIAGDDHRYEVVQYAHDSGLKLNNLGYLSKEPCPIPSDVGKGSPRRRNPSSRRRYCD